MTRSEPRAPDTPDLAEAVFVALETLDRVAPAARRAGRSEDPGSARPPRAGFDDLYRFANDPDMALSGDLARALASSPGLRADLRLLVERAARGGILVAAAASSGTITTRHGTSFRMTLRESRADRSQVYVLIQINGKAALSPRALFVIDDASACRKVSLPTPLNGTVQLLLDADSDIVAALRDPATEVFVQ
ncbi:MAG: hypothetical protein OEO83_16320 [Alphaproteobacteria bacterium]|nr:hypothetical protein [Alphaproteobacteria bacterium]